VGLGICIGRNYTGSSGPANDLVDEGRNEGRNEGRSEALTKL